MLQFGVVKKKERITPNMMKNATSLTGIEERFEEYVMHLASTLGHADRVKPFTNYCAGLLLPGERKSIEPMAAVVAPDRVSAAHQMMHHFVAKADWSDASLLSAVQSHVLPKMESQEPIRAWIVDDTCLPKKGEHSVGVARQYCGQLGKQDNCQVAVSTSLANHYTSLPAIFRLYEDWIKDKRRRKKTGIPEEIRFKTKSAIALDQLRALKAGGAPRGVILADPAYGNESAFREGVRKLELPYVLGIQKKTKVWSKGEGPLPPADYGGKRPKRLRPNPEHPPVSVLELAGKLPDSAWQILTWREGTNEDLTSRFARVRVREAHRYYNKTELPPEEWLLIEWPEGKKEPTKYWLSTLSEQVALKEMVDLAKLRWRIDRDYQELKQEIGLNHFEGRGWRGFHHHAALCTAAYGFLVAERSAFPPSGVGDRPTLRSPQGPRDFRPRGSADSHPKAHPSFHRNHKKKTLGGSGAHPVPVSLLPSTKDKFSKNKEAKFVTQ
jgi:SRSO17 transposase